MQQSKEDFNMVSVEITETIKVEVRKESLPCPMCGKTEDLKWKESPRVLRYWAINCDASLDGCGLTGGFKRSKQEAIEYWNQRA
jgi:Lar family restriction alleviation protein